MNETLSRFDAAKYLETEQDVAVFLSDSAESGDAAVMLNALSVVARALNMSELAAKAKLSREGLYKALGPAGNPSFANVAKIAEAMGVRLVFELKPKASPEPEPKRTRKGRLAASTSVSSRSAPKIASHA